MSNKSHVYCFVKLSLLQLNQRRHEDGVKLTLVRFGKHIFQYFSFFKSSRILEDYFGFIGQNNTEADSKQEKRERMTTKVQL